MVTSVEEDSSFPPPHQNPPQGSFGRDHMLRGLCGGAEPQQESAMSATLCVTPKVQLYCLQYLTEDQTHRQNTGGKAMGLLPTGLCNFSPS